MSEEGKLSAEEHARVFREEILPDYKVSEKTSFERPKAVFLAGQPGAGKGRLADRVMEELRRDAVTVDPDALRPYHLQVDEFRSRTPYTWSGLTHPDASQWADELLEATIDSKKNLVFDTTLSNGQWASELIQDLQARGYDVEVRAVAAHRLESELGVNERFTESLDEKGFGRYVPAGARDAIYSKTPNSLDTVHSQTNVPIRIFNREGVELYDSRIDAREPGEVLTEAREARLKDPRVVDDLAERWRKQEEWHENFPEAIRRNDKVSPETAVRLEDQRKELKIQESVAEASRNVQQRQQDLSYNVRGGITPNHSPVDIAESQARSRANETSTVRSADDAAEHLSKAPGSSRLIGAAVGLGVAASAYDAVQTGARVDTQLAQDNPLAAQSELTHYAARGTGGWIGGASTGLVATAASTGPGVVGFIVIGGAAVAGAHVGEHVATVLDSYEKYTHTLQGVEWRSNGLQWVRKDLGDLIDDGKSEPVEQDFSADPEKADELNYRASVAATELAMPKLPSPRNPYSQPAAENDAVSLRRADWVRNPETGTWDRKVVEGFEQPGAPMIRMERANPERAAELDRASQQVIRDNIANGPAPMAARFEVVHRSEGWERFGGVPPSIASALRDDSLLASDGNLYQRTAEGQWQRNGESVVAAGNLRHELDSTRAALQPQLAQHQEQVAAIPPRQPPTLENIERKDLMATYLVHGVKPSPEQLEAALEAVRRTQQEQGVNPLTTSLHLGLNADKKFDVDSPIEHIGRDADGANRRQAVTSPLEVQLAMLDLRSPPPTTPEPSELRIANLSPQQQAALEQVVREANRLGLQRDDVQATARQAVADATDGVPDIVTTTVDAAQLRPAAKPSAAREVDASSPTLTKAVAAVVEPAAEKPQEKQSEQNRTEAGRTPTETLDGVQQTATAVPLAAVTLPPVREAGNVRTLADPGAPPIPTQAEPATVAAAPAEPIKPDVIAAKPPEQQAPTSQPAPDAPTPTTPPTAPHTAPVEAEATLTPDTPTLTPTQPAPPVAPVTAEAEPAPDDGTLRRGDRGDDVEMLQFRLQRVGYTGSDDAPLQRNGQFDAATEQAVRQLQRDHGLPETGSVDPETVQALAVAQHAKIESRKTENAAVEPPAVEKTTKPVELAAVFNGERTAETTAASLTSPLHDEPRAGMSRQVEAPPVPGNEHSKEREQPHAQAGDKAMPAPAMDAQDLARMSLADQAMFAKIRAGAPSHVSDETVAATMLAAKQNQIHDADSIKLVAAANGKLWVEAHTPGFHTGVSLSEPPPAMQDTLRETQAVNQQREQQLAQEASQRNPDDPSRGPTR